MNNLIITAKMSSPIAVSDNWTPALDGILQYLMLEQEGKWSCDPDPDSLIEADLPLEKIQFENNWVWAVSSPCYKQSKEQTTKFRKRWDYQEKHCDWGKKVQKVDTATGHFKNYDLPLYLRSIPEVHWFAIGNAKSIKDLLLNCKAIGKKRSLGNGQISEWSVETISDNFCLQKGTDLMRPISYKWVDKNAFTGYSMLFWGYKPPARLSINQALCLMPLNNIF